MLADWLAGRAAALAGAMLVAVQLWHACCCQWLDMCGMHVCKQEECTLVLIVDCRLFELWLLLLNPEGSAAKALIVNTVASCRNTF
jgi:hypothetical protein